MTKYQKKVIQIRKPEEVNNQLAIFEKGGWKVRSIVDEKGEPWFVARDVALSLGYSKPQKAAREHCKHLKILKGSETEHLTDSPRGIGLIPETDVYRLIMRSNLPNAEKFQDWVVEEILPSIRKTGQYSMKQLTPAEMFLAQAEMMVAHEKKLNEHEDRLAIVEAKQHLNSSNTGYFTIVAIGIMKKIPIPIGDAKILGKNATKLSKERGYRVDRMPDQRWGFVNAYHQDILEEVFADFYGEDYE